MMRWNLVLTSFSSLLLAGVFPAAHAAQAANSQRRKPLLTHGICGSVGNPDGTPVPDRLNPSSVLDQYPVQRLMLDLAEKPRDKAYLQVALSETGVGIQDLETIGLIRPQGAEYVIAFALFTKSDLVQIRRVVESRAALLAAAYVERRPEIERLLAQYPVNGVDRKAAAYILLGCFSLDWDGLDLTAEKGYRKEDIVRPGIGTFGVWAEERGDHSLKGIYWGSHNEYGETYVLTSFGDHFSLPRYAFPDLIWRMSHGLSSVGVPGDLENSLDPVVGDALGVLAARIARTLMALRDGPRSPADLAQVAGTDEKTMKHLLALLAGLQYVRPEGDRYAASIPLLTKTDEPMVRGLLALSREVMAAWLAANYQPLRKALEGITPLRYGVPYEQVFTQLWHYIFGITNRQLAEAGLFADPYAAARRFKGFIPAIWSPTLSAHH